MLTGPRGVAVCKRARARSASRLVVARIPSTGCLGSRGELKTPLSWDRLDERELHVERSSGDGRKRQGEARLPRGAEGGHGKRASDHDSRDREAPCMFSRGCCSRLASSITQTKLQTAPKSPTGYAEHLVRKCYVQRLEKLRCSTCSPCSTYSDTHQNRVIARARLSS